MAHITPNTGSTPTWASQLAACARSAEEFYRQVNYLKRVMDTMISGSDYTVLEAQFGLTAGQGQTAYNLVAGALSQCWNAGSGSFAMLLAQIG